MNNAEVELLNRAIDALQRGDLQESESLFQKLVGSFELAGQALAGIGMIRLNQGDYAGARELFQNALRRGPDADALYGLGVIEERAGDNQKAFGYQLKALQVNPGHAGARGRLEALQKAAFSTPPPAPPVPPRAAPRAPAPAAPAARFDSSAFEVILTGDEKQARDQAFAFLQRFRMKRRPRLSAYFGSILAVIGLLGLIVIGFINSPFAAQPSHTSAQSTGTSAQPGRTSFQPTHNASEPTRREPSPAPFRPPHGGGRR
jgi:tetratricopeptide (TPR) repeat protein